MSEPDLDPDQRAALDALVGGATLDEAASAAGVSLRTLYSWRTGETRGTAFRAALERERRELAITARDKFRGAVPLAADTVIAVMKDKDARPADRLRACEILMSRIGWHGDEDAPIEATATDVKARLDQIWGAAAPVEVEEPPRLRVADD